MRRNYLSHPELQRCRWSLGTDKWFQPAPCNGCDFVSMPGLKLIHVKNKGICYQRPLGDDLLIKLGKDVLIFLTTSFRKISLSIKQARVVFNFLQSLWDSLGLSASVLLRHMSNSIDVRMLTPNQGLSDHTVVFLQSMNLACGLGCLGGNECLWINQWSVIWDNIFLRVNVCTGEMAQPKNSARNDRIDILSIFKTFFSLKVGCINTLFHDCCLIIYIA